MKKIFLIFSVLAITFFACKKEQETDLIEGKWVNKVHNILATDCQKKSYYVFAPYDLDVKKRTIYFHNLCTQTIKNELGEDSVISFPPEYKGLYTISGDTLMIKNEKDVTEYYTIDYINSEEMMYHDPKKDYVFRRVK